MKKHIAMLTVAHPADDVRICKKEAHFLAQNGWEVTILAPNAPKSSEGNIRFTSIPMEKGRFERFCLSKTKVIEAVEKTDAGILILHDPELMPLIPFLRNMGRKVIFDAHEDLPRSVLSRGWITPPLRWPACAASVVLQRRYLPAAHAVIAATVPIAEKLCAVGLSPTLVRNRLTASDTALIERALLHEKQLKNTVCYAGAVSERRGAERMIRACFDAGATLLLAGRFESDKLRSKLEAMKEYSCVRYEGVLDRQGIASLFSRAQAGLLLLDDTPAYRESEPIKLFEYLAAGLPVIASDFDYWRTFSFDGRIRFARDDGEAASLIRKTLDDTADLGQIRFHRGAMQKRFSFQREGERLLKLCEKLLEGSQ